MFLFLSLPGPGGEPKIFWFRLFSRLFAAPMTTRLLLPLSKGVQDGPHPVHLQVPACGVDLGPVGHVILVAAGLDKVRLG